LQSVRSTGLKQMEQKKALSAPIRTSAKTWEITLISNPCPGESDFTELAKRLLPCLCFR
jgi:hypothetical protein